MATVWMGGCSGCHMSLLDMDERLLDLAQQVDIVYGPLLDIKTFPEQVDVTLVEGAVANEDHLRDIREIRDRSRVLVAFGDCAVTGNVTALRNPLKTAQPVLARAYLELTACSPVVPDLPGVVPVLLDRVLPLNAVVKVDFFLPGCPPPADRIHHVICELAAGRAPVFHTPVRFG